MGAYDLEKKIPFRILTFNIRYATTSPVPGETPWATRRPRLTAQLRFAAAGATSTGAGADASAGAHPSTFLCLQEALAHQVRDVLADLGPGWAHIGVGRDDGAEAGEFSPVLYHAAVWACERQRTYWLSPTPGTPGSRGWDAVLPRVVTVGRFAHRGCGARVVVLSTHFDHRGVVAREESARLILRLADEWVEEAQATPTTTTTTTGDGSAQQEQQQQQQQHPIHHGDGDGSGANKKPKPPVFLGGDFNSTPTDGAYRTMTASGSGMTDLATLFRAGERHGHELTYSSFGEPWGEVPKRIDFLFVKDTAGLAFRTFGVLANRFDDGVFLSDHRAVVADVEIPVVGQHPG